MMENERVLYFLALQKVDGIGCRNARKLVELFGGPKEVLMARESELLKVKGLGSKLARNLKSKEIFRLAEKELERARKARLTITCLMGADYPRNMVAKP